MSKICHFGCDDIFKNWHSLYVHIRKIHKITTKEYYDKFLKKKDEGVCYCGNETTLLDLGRGYHKFCSTKCLSNCEETKKRRVDNFKKKTGFDNPSQDPKIKEKKRLTFQEHYNVDNIFKITDKIKQSNINKFGFSSWSETEEGRLKHRVDAIKQTELRCLNNEPLMPNIGFRERECLNELQNFISEKILRNDHRFAYSIGRIPDGLIPELNIVILFHERAHYSDNNCIDELEDTIQTTKDYESQGLKVFKISEKDWKENKNHVIDLFKNLLDRLII